MMDGKAQNDTARTIWYLALRFGREDDVEFINYMTGGRSRSELLHAGDKSLPESNSLQSLCLRHGDTGHRNVSVDAAPERSGGMAAPRHRNEQGSGVGC